jgi:hypothetical protein
MDGIHDGGEQEAGLIGLISGPEHVHGLGLYGGVWGNVKFTSAVA